MPILSVRSVSKSFCVHGSETVEVPVLRGIHLDLFPGECAGILGRSGVGKSTLLRMIYGNYRCAKGSIQVFHEGSTVDIASASATRILGVRGRTIGFVRQFLKVLPRMNTLDVVSEPMVLCGVEEEVAEERAAGMLRRLNISELLWRLSPMTFSGGEQQRVNLARCFVVDYPIVLLDEPTASLDGDNMLEVVSLINEVRVRGGAILGVFHDERVREVVCTKFVDLEVG